MNRAAGASAPPVPWRPLLAVAVALAALFALTLARVQSWETLSQAARAVDHPLVSERLFSARLFHPNHLVFMPVARAVHRAAAAAGAPDPFANLALLSAVAGALLCALAGALAAALGSGTKRAVAVALLAGVSNIVWRLSTEIGAIVPGAMLVALAALGIARARRTAGWAAAGLAIGAAILVHQMAAMFAIGAGLVLAAAVARGNLPWRAFAAWALCGAIPAAAAYAVVARAEAGAVTPLEVLAWVFAVSDRSTIAALPPAALVRNGAVAALESWVTLAPLHALRAGRMEPGVLAGAAAAALGLGVAAAWIVQAAPGLARAASARWRVAAIAAGLAALFAFVCWYQAGNHLFWVFAPPFALALLAPFAPAPPPRLRAAATLAIVAAAAAVCLANLVFRVLPARDPARAPYADVLAMARESLQPGDLVVTGPGASVLDAGAVALPLLAGVEVWLAPPPDDPAAPEFRRTLAPVLARVRAAGGRVHAIGAARAVIGPLAGPARAVRPFRADTLWRLEPLP